VNARPRVSIHWFRRDLRLSDNHGLLHALQEREPVLPLFIFDTAILERLQDRADRRVDHIHRALRRLKHEAERHGGSLLVEHGRPAEVWERLLERYEITGVTTNHDHEPYALARDKAVAELLAGRGIPFTTFKDISIFERSEVMKDDGGPYTVFTPYSRKWRSLFKLAMADPHPSEQHLDRLWRTEPLGFPTLEELGFQPTDLLEPEREVSDRLIRNYADTRNIPGVEGTSRMSVHLRFGTVSVRALIRQALPLSETYVNELIWREFYMQVLWHFPHVVGASFKPAYDRIPWRNDEQLFHAWCEGRTGYPLVDAGMRELLATGHMHNRVRMVVSSFLTKHLLIDWRLGEAWFARHLLDFELSSNNGGWQWASGGGCDAAPYFRVFNPTLQLQRFDPALTYVKRWVKEYGTANYARPIVVHDVARKLAIETYRKALDGGMKAEKHPPTLFH
jgi:deoxyribodipyrimidine photo-lyase